MVNGKNVYIVRKNIIILKLTILIVLGATLVDNSLIKRGYIRIRDKAV